MDSFTAVFNCHCNDAEKRANREFVEKFGQATFDRVMAPLLREGIMDIFNDNPTEYTGQWVRWVTEFVNENRVEAANAD